MSSKSGSDSTFELIDDLNNDQRNEKILISPSLSSTASTDFIEELNEEFRMDSEFKDKLITSNVLNNQEKFEENSSLNVNQQLQNQLISNISSNVQLSSSGDNLKNDNFDNNKLQEQLNMQIQSNQEHLRELSLQQEQLIQQQLKNDQFIQQQSYNQQKEVNLQETSPIQMQLNLNQSHQAQLVQNEIKSEQSNTASNLSNEVVKLSVQNFDTSSILGWFSKQDFINKVAENAVNGFNSVLITLDPQMKEIRLAGGPSILVTSNQSFDVGSIRDGFLDVFKRATVKSIDTFLSVETAIQLVGFSTAHKISLERIKGLRSNISIVPQNQIIVSIENFLYNFNDNWFDSDYILLDDPSNKIQLSVHTQGTPVENKYIEQLKSKASNNKFREDGFSIRLDSLIASDLKCSIGEWHKEYVGFDKSKLHYTAILLLSNLYKNKLKSIGRLNE